MLSSALLSTAFLFTASSIAQDLVQDPGVAGPPLEVVHLYNDQWPTGDYLTRVYCAVTMLIQRKVSPFLKTGESSQITRRALTQTTQMTARMGNTQSRNL
jgi:hypothetical protein